MVGPTTVFTCIILCRVVVLLFMCRPLSVCGAVVFVTCKRSLFQQNMLCCEAQYTVFCYLLTVGV